MRQAAPNRRKQNAMKTIGRKDKADFPEFNLNDIDIKIDTGAYTSSIHSHAIKETTAHGETFIEFTLLDPSHQEYNNKTLKTKHFKRKAVRSSFGDTEQRYVIATTILLFGKEYPIELSLSKRSDMKFPILIGRKFLSRRFIVNPTLKDQSFQLKHAHLDK
jgi:hypothetical protein